MKAAASRAFWPTNSGNNHRLFYVVVNCAFPRKLRTDEKKTIDYITRSVCAVIYIAMKNW